MRRITLWLASTATTLVLLFSYHTSTSSGTTTSIAAPTNGGSVAAAGSGSSSGSDPAAASGSSSGSGDSTTYTGAAASTRFGDVQVQITIASGKVTAATVTQVPWRDHRDQEINSQAVPILNEEAVSAQSSNIDMVSGATYTSQGYAQSLQSALDQAGL